jgi:hypothetical protein
MDRVSAGEDHESEHSVTLMTLDHRSDGQEDLSAARVGGEAVYVPLSDCEAVVGV